MAGFIVGEDQLIQYCGLVALEHLSAMTRQVKLPVIVGQVMQSLCHNTEIA